MKRTTRGFTLVEVSVMIVIITLLSALVIPNVVSMKKSRDRREVYTKLGRVIRQAREEAISQNKTLTLSYDESKTLMQVMDGDNTLLSVDLPQGLTCNNFVLEDKASNAAEWKVKFYPDGRSDGGSVQITEGSAIQSVDIKKDGRVSLVEGPIPDATTQQWPAGDYEHRS